MIAGRHPEKATVPLGGADGPVPAAVVGDEGDEGEDDVTVAGRAAVVNFVEAVADVAAADADVAVGAGVTASSIASPSCSSSITRLHGGQTDSGVDSRHWLCLREQSLGLSLSRRVKSAASMSGSQYRVSKTASRSLALLTLVVQRSGDRSAARLASTQSR